ncbi:type II secretion system protein [Hydrogenimonas urashimensis]|uniref:type II secretion system protein n=1 Tax=Hydrogenimonas urashimensis TaxID=2740515 RepID=UPI003D276763
MIELIFVIVILGILASVAVMKLNATREDAQISSISGRVSAILGEISSHAVASATLDGNVTHYSNIAQEMVANGEATVENTADTTRLKIRAGEVPECLVLKIIHSVTEENLSLEMNSDENDYVCRGVQRQLADRNVTLRIRGRIAKY